MIIPSWIDQALSYLIPCTIAASAELCGGGKKLGFMLAFVVQALNGCLALAAGLWGLLLGPLLVGPVFYRQYLRWKKSNVNIERR